jgi:predicted acyltransferase
MSVDQSGRGRIVSLDQFRGYTVVGMLLVNFLGSCDAVPAIFKHHTPTAGTPTQSCRSFFSRSASPID